ncbi:hypothetical protein TSMG0029 [Halocynthia phage JM-2012]|uniref:hypothetical protein n=1 Tax=Halocynthia phage JM-2012 TaxID=1173297 RepID=UPI00025C68EC|nr:hypothetical protein TSMG0029 [Halocynthia phage JM-2012]AFI55312.1 hypothetical protein TSMG0029 [Halocynthia phage JM-2012]
MNTLLNKIENGKVIAETTLPVKGELIEYETGIYAHRLTANDNVFIQTPEGTFVNGEYVISCSEQSHMDAIASVGIVYKEVEDGIIYTNEGGTYSQHISSDRSTITWVVGTAKIVMNLNNDRFYVTDGEYEVSHLLTELAIMTKLYGLCNKVVAGEL